ncbi:MAG TPA: hypothetical protein VFC45_10725 [Pseudolabrys sp.]|nr:hypothetical protein [Pseudolabrys sp.]
MRMHGAFDRSILASLSLTLAMGLAGCSGASMIDQVPTSVGGEPAGTPERPTTVYAYPAVHDLPPPRATAPLNEEEQVKMEKELAAVREKQEAPDGAAKKTAAPAKKKPETANTGTTGTTGTQDGTKTNP